MCHLKSFDRTNFYYTAESYEMFRFREYLLIILDSLDSGWDDSLKLTGFVSGKSFENSLPCFIASGFIFRCFPLFYLFTANFKIGCLISTLLIVSIGFDEFRWVKRTFYSERIFVVFSSKKFLTWDKFFCFCFFDILKNISHRLFFFYSAILIRLDVQIKISLQLIHIKMFQIRTPVRTFRIPESESLNQSGFRKFWKTPSGSRFFLSLFSLFTVSNFEF